MRKLTFISSLLLLSLAGCKGASEAQALETYKAESEAIVVAFQDQVLAIREDASLTDAQKNEAISNLDDEVSAEYADLALAAIKKYPSGELAVLAVNNLMGFDCLADAIDLLKGDAANDETVVAIRAAVEVSKKTAEGQMFTDFTVVQDPDDVENSTVKFSDFVGKGKYVLVDFWASWCGPCKQELPNIANVYNKYKGDKFDVLSVAVWDEPADTKAAAPELGIVWNQIINAQRIPTDIYGIQGIPHIMLVGPDGIIVKRDLRGANIEKAVVEALGL